MLMYKDKTYNYIPYTINLDNWHDIDSIDDG